jgi:hypothetical protein
VDLVAHFFECGFEVGNLLENLGKILLYFDASTFIHVSQVRQDLGWCNARLCRLMFEVLSQVLHVLFQPLRYLLKFTGENRVVITQCNALHLFADSRS